MWPQGMQVSSKLDIWAPVTLWEAEGGRCKFEAGRAPRAVILRGGDPVTRPGVLDSPPGTPPCAVGSASPGAR